MSVECCEPRRLFAAVATFTVVNANDSGAGSLRQAILDANANLNNAGEHDNIRINIAGGDKVIDLASALPAISDPIHLGWVPDGTAVTGPFAELNGAAAGAGANGLVLTSTASSSQITGVAVNRFSGNGIVVQSDSSGVSGSVYVGTDLAGTAANLGNAGHGILITGDNNLVGDARIVFNGGDGVAVEGGGTGNLISPNSPASAIHSNGGQAVDVGANGITPNDPGDGDAGPNASQNFPVLAAVGFSGNTVTVSGTINTTPNTFVSLDFFASPVARREGWQTLADQGGTPPSVQTDAGGNASFNVTLVPADPGGTLSAASYVTALATGLDNGTLEFNTSEFSAPLGGPRPWLAPGSAATWNAEAGTLTVTGAASIVADPGADAPIITANGAAAVLTINPAAATQVNASSLTLTGGATATLTDAAAERVLVLHAGGVNVSGAGSALNLTDNAMVVKGGTLAGVKSLITSGFAGGAWNGNGIRSSNAAADVTSALGYASMAQLGANSFLGVGGLVAADVVVRYTWYGDTNLDRLVNTDDIINILAAGKLDAGLASDWFEGDMTYDALANTDDIIQILAAGKLDQP